MITGTGECSVHQRGLTVPSTNGVVIGGSIASQATGGNYFNQIGLKYQDDSQPGRDKTVEKFVDLPAPVRLSY